MANQVWVIVEGVPFLNGLDYELWKIRMESYLMVFNEDIWMFMIYGETNEFNTEAKGIIRKGLSKLDVEEVRHSETTKEMLDKL